MINEILPVSLEDKFAAISYIRQDLIPDLVTKDYSSARCLLILHRVGTWQAKSGDIDTNVLIKTFTAFYGGIDPIPNSLLGLEKELAELMTAGPDKFIPSGSYMKGNYRILGRFAPNCMISKYVNTAQDYFTGAIPVSSHDYQNPDSPLYYPPILNIDKLMSKISNKFDQEFVQANTLEEVAKTTADFYFWGLVMIHPFLGGNHRGYDRFIEYAFAKKGLEIKTPLNETLNIPNDDPFNLNLYQGRKLLLEETDLTSHSFNFNDKKDLVQWLEYQNRLYQIIDSHIDKDNQQATEVAQAILDWR